MTSAGIEPVTFQLVAQHLNHSATAVPMPRIVIYKKNSHLNTGEKYYICEESKSIEQLNGPNTFKPNAILTAVFQQDPSATATHFLCSAT
jgi:hypothetical protein